MVNPERLDGELKAAGVQFTGLSISPPPSRIATCPCDLITRQDGIIVAINWPDTTAQTQWLSAATTIIQAHDGTQTQGEKLDKANQKNRVLAALVIRASSTPWAGLPAGKKAAVQGIIDAAATDLIALLS